MPVARLPLADVRILQADLTVVEYHNGEVLLPEAVPLLVDGDGLRASPDDAGRLQAPVEFGRARPVGSGSSPRSASSA